MTGHAVEACLSLRMTLDAKAHVDFFYRHHSIHVLNIAVALLAFDSGMDMRAMRKLDEIGQRINAVPSNLERRLRMIVPRPCDRLDPADDSAAMASHASLDRRDACVLRAARVFMTVLAGNLVHPGMNPMAEGYGLYHVHPRQPRTLGKSDYGHACDQQDGRQGQEYPVHLCFLRSNCGRTRAWINRVLGRSFPVMALPRPTRFRTQVSTLGDTCLL